MSKNRNSDSKTVGVEYGKRCNEQWYLDENIFGLGRRRVNIRRVRSGRGRDREERFSGYAIRMERLTHEVG